MYMCAFERHWLRFNVINENIYVKIFLFVLLKYICEFLFIKDTTGLHCFRVVMYLFFNLLFQ